MYFVSMDSLLTILKKKKKNKETVSFLGESGGSSQMRRGNERIKYLAVKRRIKPNYGSVVREKSDPFSLVGEDFT